MRISDDYRALLEKMHRESASFGSSSGKHREKILGFGYDDILDYGCGKGRLGVPCKQYDPAIPEFSKEPDPADLLVCTDVLEHIEPECIDDVLKHIHSLTRKMAYLVISLKPAQKNLPDGRNAHILVKDVEWWRDKLSPYFSFDRFKQIGRDLEVIAKPL